MHPRNRWHNGPPLRRESTPTLYTSTAWTSRGSGKRRKRKGTWRRGSRHSRARSYRRPYAARCRRARCGPVGWQHRHKRTLTGGLERFHRMGLDNSTVVTWLDGSGYRTALLGRYLSDSVTGYEPMAGRWGGADRELRRTGSWRPCPRAHRAARTCPRLLGRKDRVQNRHRVPDRREKDSRTSPPSCTCMKTWPASPHMPPRRQNVPRGRTQKDRASEGCRVAAEGRSAPWRGLEAPCPPLRGGIQGRAKGSLSVLRGTKVLRKASHWCSV